MRPARVPERIGYDPKPFDLPDLMPGPDTKPAQPPVIFLLLVRQLAALGFLVRIIRRLMFLIVALIRTVAISTRALGSFGPARRTARSWRLPGWEGDTLAIRPHVVTIYSFFSVWRFFFPE